MLKFFIIFQLKQQLMAAGENYYVECDKAASLKIGALRRLDKRK